MLISCSLILNTKVPAVFGFYCQLKDSKMILTLSIYTQASSISAMFDADAPGHPRGCIAQVRGLAELLRVIKDY
jgi:hypothetical protein